MPHVEILYKNSTKMDDIPLLLEIPECGAKCPLKKLYELYDYILPTKSHDEECKLRDGEFKPMTKNRETT